MHRFHTSKISVRIVRESYTPSRGTFGASIRRAYARRDLYFSKAMSSLHNLLNHGCTNERQANFKVLPIHTLEARHHLHLPLVEHLGDVVFQIIFTVFTSTRFFVQVTFLVPENGRCSQNSHSHVCLREQVNIPRRKLVDPFVVQVSV